MMQLITFDDTTHSISKALNLILQEKQVTMSVEKKIIAIELNHKSAPIEIREIFSASADQVQRTLEDLKEKIPEIFIISTCNRFSVYSYCNSKYPILEVFKSFCDIITTKHLTILYNEAAVKHLFSTAAGLESQTIGEHEILGQIRNTFTMSIQSKKAGPILNELVNKAIHAGKRVRTETLIGKHAVSLAAISSNRIKKTFGDVSSISVMVYGTGEMAEIVLKMLNKMKVANIDIVSDDIVRASKLAISYNAIPLTYEEALITIPLTEVVIGATRTKKYILTKTVMVQHNAQNPELIIDLGMPRNFDPDINSISHINLYDLDALKQTASNAIEKRKKEIVLASAIIEDEVTKYQQWLMFRNYVPLIQKLKTGLEYVKKEMLKNVLKKTPNLSEENKLSMKSLANTVVKKILSQTIASIRKMNDSRLSDDVVKKIPEFNIDVIYRDFIANMYSVIEEELETANV